MTARPLRGLSITAWGAYNDAQLTGPLPVTSTTRGSKGDQLPFSAEWSGSVSVDGEFPVALRLTGFVGASVSYTGDRMGGFTGPGIRQELPDYTQVGVNAGMKGDAWTVNLYGNNIFDKRGAVLGGLGFLYPTSFTYIQPRTVGLSLTRAF